MVTNLQSAPTREDIALREVGHTDVSAGTVRFLLIFFLLSIAAVPTFELVTATSARRSGDLPPWTHLTRLPVEIPARISTEAANSGFWNKLLVGNRTVVKALIAFEDALEDDSRLGRTLRPPIQLLMTRWLGAGNERAYVGREGWLFYRPDVEYVTNGPFLDPARLDRRVATTDQWDRAPQPDPRKAIVAFKRQLDVRGIELVVMPTPGKPTIHPEYLAHGDANTQVPLRNPSYLQLIADLEREGVLVFDATTALAETLRASQTTQYLATDTHWRPEAMEAVAERLVAFVRTHVALPERADVYRVEPREIRHIGDIAAMLDLPERQTLYPPETVTIRRVVSADGSAWRSSRDADVLLLGDSFSNIYSLASMGWGDGAGLSEHVGYLLQRPIDRIVQNDQGAYATRELLRRAGNDRLAGKRVVIYQFAERELMFGDWKVIEWP